MKVSIVYHVESNDEPVIDGFYLLPHTARARASTLRKRGFNAFVSKRELRTIRDVIILGKSK